MPVAARDEDACLRGCTDDSIQNPNLVIDEPDLGELRIRFGQGAPQCSVERVYRTIPVSDSVMDHIGHPDFDGGFADGFSGVSPHGNMVGLHRELRLSVRLQDFLDEEGQGCLGGFIFVTKVLPLLDALSDTPCLGLIGCQLKSQFAGFEQDVRTP